MSGSMEPVLAAIAQLGRELGGRIERLETRFDRLETRFDGLEEAVTQLRVDSMERMDRQQDMLTSIRVAATVRTQWRVDRSELRS